VVAIALPAQGARSVGFETRRRLGNFLCGAVAIVLLLTGTPLAYGQAFDGTWTGTYSCPASPSGKSPPYSHTVSATIIQNQFHLERNTSTIYELTQGVMQSDGSLSAAGTGQRRDRPTTWDTQYSGKASPNTIILRGRTADRNPYTIQLSNTHPAPYSLAGIELAHQQQATAAATEGDRLAAAEREREKTVERQKTAEAAQQKAEAEHKSDTERQRLIADLETAKQTAAQAEQQVADLETAKQTAAQAEQQVADLKAAQDKAAKEQMAEAQRQRDETEHLRQETERLAASQQAEAQAASDHTDAIVAFLKDMVVPDSLNLDEWIARHPAIPVQQQQFCRIVKHFESDIKQIRLVKNEIRENRLYQERQQDFEALLPNGRFENWIVEVDSVTEAADGSAAITFKPPCEVMLGSDACQKSGSKIRATIQSDTLLFREAEKVGSGDFVVVSGAILYASHDSQTQALPQYASIKTGEYCKNTDGREVFVTAVDYLVKLQ
jgi:hypothetical protein